MNTLFNAMNQTETENGDAAFRSTNSSVLDFFYQAPVSRGKDIIHLFERAIAENPELAIRALLWLRDVRQGAGERDTFRSLVKYLAEFHVEIASKVMNKIPELGRFDDLKVFFGTTLEKLAARVWLSEIAKGNALAAKWAPRKDKKGAKPLRKVIGFTEEEWRKLVVSNSDTIEQRLCSGDFENIEFSKQPSLAMSRYAKALTNKSLSYAAFVEELEAGETTINAGAIFPHDVVKSAISGNSAAANAQWKALPDYFEGGKYKNVLPVVDVSASMDQTASGSTSCMDVAIALGIYCSERMSGWFNHSFVTFSERPEVQNLTPGSDLASKIRQLKNSDWGYNTNFDSVFDQIVKYATEYRVTQSQMPEIVLCISDMQFDQASGRRPVTKRVKDKFAKAGYEVPKLVFWNVRGTETTPATEDTKGIALISGFSPSVMKSVLSGEIDPIAVMLRTLNVERYNF